MKRLAYPVYDIVTESLVKSVLDDALKRIRLDVNNLSAEEYQELEREIKVELENKINNSIEEVIRELINNYNPK